MCPAFTLLSNKASITFESLLRLYYLFIDKSCKNIMIFPKSSLNVGTTINLAFGM